jgi:O-antigen/teichoic acid export membrane protein
MTGNTSLKLVNSIVLFGLTLGLNVLLIPHWGVVGAATAALAATAAVNILCLAEVFVLFRLLPYNVSFVKPVAAGLVALAAAWVISQLFHAEANLVHTAINAIIILAVYVGMISLLGLSPEDRAVLARLRRRMGTIARSVTGPADRS